MSSAKYQDFRTRVIHDCQSPADWEGSTLAPIHQSAANRHPTAENLSDTFGGKTGDQFNDMGFGGVLSFGLGDQAACFKFINALKLVYNLANLGDCKTLVIHPYSSQYLSFDEPTRQKLSITPDLVRLSVGIEAAADICDDLGQTLDTI